MFDKSLEYRLVQIRGNRFSGRESFIQEYIYRFYSHNVKGRLKYIATIKSYRNGLLTLDFYPKVNLTPKSEALNDVRDLFNVYVNKQNSAIFLIHKAKATEKQDIIAQYEHIFSEIN